VKKKELRRQVNQLQSQLRALQLELRSEQLENVNLKNKIVCRDWHISDLQRSLSLTEVERNVYRDHHNGVKQ
jgi:hypothetical protein